MNHSTEHWQPTASMAVLRQRAKMLAVARSFFARLDMLEVETPVLSVNGVTDPHLSQLSCRLKSRGNDSFYLQTSPEYYMKRLLAAGSSDIFQICRVFRDRELGARHQPEFTMIEWYRLKKTLDQMIDETCAFITAIGMSMDFSVGTVTRHSYQAAFEAITGLDPLPAECAELSQCAERLLPNALSPSLIRQLGTDRNAWLDLLMSHHVIPALATRIGRYRSLPGGAGSPGKAEPER